MMDPELRTLESEFEKRMIEARLPYVITSIDRPLLMQIALYMQGRLPVDETNMFRYQAGMKRITAEGNNHKVTWTLNSAHVTNKLDEELNNDLSRAFDIALFKYDRVHWDIKISVNCNEIPDYEEAGKIGEDVGLFWGGHFHDYCHFQLKGRG
jgi:hypothetical protein